MKTSRWYANEQWFMNDERQCSTWGCLTFFIYTVQHFFSSSSSYIDDTFCFLSVLLLCLCMFRHVQMNVTLLLAHTKHNKYKKKKTERKTFRFTYNNNMKVLVLVVFFLIKLFQMFYGPVFRYFFVPSGKMCLMIHPYNELIDCNWIVSFCKTIFNIPIQIAHLI